MGKRRTTKRPRPKLKRRKNSKPKTVARKRTPKKKRDLVKTPGLNKNLFSRVKQEYHDIDYAQHLSKKDQIWLSQFMEEDLGAQLNEVTLKNKYNRKAMNKSKKQRKNCFDRNNARQRDIYGLSRAGGKLDHLDQPMLDMLDSTIEDPNYEGSRIEILEATEESNDILSLKEYEVLKDHLTPEANAFYIKHYKIK
jgi:hypothetical protein